MIVTIILTLTISLLSVYSIKLIINGLYYGFILLILSILAIILVIFPNLTLVMANIFGVGRGADLLLYLCFVIGLLLYLSITVKIRKIQLMQTKIIRFISSDVKE